MKSGSVAVVGGGKYVIFNMNESTLKTLNDGGILKIPDESIRGIKPEGRTYVISNFKDDAEFKKFLKNIST
jgi:hypothetical protein